MTRYGAASYWLSDDSWTWFKTRAEVERITVRGYIETHYREWATKELCIQDSAFQELWNTRVAQGVGVRDSVLYRAMYTEFGGRWPHVLDLSVNTVTQLAICAIRWQLPRKFITINPVGLTALTLEMVGREWVC